MLHPKSFLVDIGKSRCHSLPWIGGATVGFLVSAVALRTTARERHNDTPNLHRGYFNRDLTTDVVLGFSFLVSSVALGSAACEGNDDTSDFHRRYLNGYFPLDDWVRRRES